MASDRHGAADATIGRIDVSAYTIPTATPEADGTKEWNSTTLLLVEISAGGQRGMGFSYADPAAAQVIAKAIDPVVRGSDAMAIPEMWGAMVKACRNLGRPGVAATAISAVDVALWDLKARILELPITALLGIARRKVPIYGSGGFTSYSVDELTGQLAGWIQQGIPRVKMKIGKGWGENPEEDVARVQAARRAIGANAELFIDANGAYAPKQAVRLAARFAEANVSYFEEPVSADHLEQLAFVRSQIPMDLAAGEYGYDPWYFKNMLAAGSVDILQADVTRCLGVTGWLEAAHLAHSYAIPFSAHTAPSLHAPIACSVPQISHLEYFFDHVRIEEMLLDGVLHPQDGCLVPDLSRPGFGYEFKHKDAERWRVRV